MYGVPSKCRYSSSKSVLGTIVLFTLSNGFNVLNLGSNYQYVVQGVVLVAASAIYTFASRGGSAYRDAAAQLRRRYEAARFGVIHAHFGLTAWPALALRGAPHAVTLHGTDLAHPRSRAITLAALPFIDLVAPVSEPLAQLIPSWAIRRQFAVLPCGVDDERFRPIDRLEARHALGLDEAGPYLLFPADPARPEKRYDRALEIAQDTRLLTLGHVNPDEVPLWVNAANAVLVTSERESFGLAVLEALACNVPVVATPVGIAPQALDGVTGCYCGPFGLAAWRAALAPLLAAEDPRVDGRHIAEAYSVRTMAERVLAAWKTLS